MRTCSSCGYHMHDSMFYGSRRFRKDGTEHLRRRCKDCQREYGSDYWRRNAKRLNALRRKRRNLTRVEGRA